jgi:hypothetical protein
MPGKASWPGEGGERPVRVLGRRNCIWLSPMLTGRQNRARFTWIPRLLVPPYLEACASKFINFVLLLVWVVLWKVEVELMRCMQRAG